MKTLLICKDCGDQLNSADSADLQKLTSMNKSVTVFFTTCMGNCPLKKISTIELNENIINPYEVKSLSPEELFSTLKKCNLAP